MANLIRLRDFTFLLYDVFRADELCKSPLYSAHDRATFDAILQTAKVVAEKEFEPFAAKLDQNPPEWIHGQIKLIPEMKTAMNAFVENGFMAAPFPESVGGLQLPTIVSNAAMSFFDAANISAIGYPFLTIAAANLLVKHADKELKDAFLGPMIEGRFYGTMCLSEPHAGSSLADIRCKATPTADGTYRLRGTKMWISAADHELGENIVHLVLAKLPDAPAGVKGISLFLVPKYRLNDDGTMGSRNDIHVVGLNHKMGYNGTVNTVLELGENNDCIGQLVGRPHQGLHVMFSMMNEARIGVGIGAAALGYAGLRYSLDYALQRPQGRHVRTKDPATEQICIIEHADVRRMLLAQKALAEGALALGFYAARLVDEIEIAEHAGENSQETASLLDLLTPIVKAWPSDFCLDANSLAIQVLGGYGYTRDYPVERIYRDNRLNSIHEGTNGIQALDLLGRKVPMNGGAAVGTLMERMQSAIQVGLLAEATREMAQALGAACTRLAETTKALGAVAMTGALEKYLANATPYLHLMGHTVVAWLWLRQANEANEQLALSDDPFLKGKLQAARYFYRWELPRTIHWAERLSAMDTTSLDTHAEWF
jgi:alkylation response protein AidB-like acyl-CoA dehydrogenase